MNIAVDLQIPLDLFSVLQEGGSRDEIDGKPSHNQWCSSVGSWGRGSFYSSLL